MHTEVAPIAFRSAILILPTLTANRAMAPIESPCNEVCAIDPISALCAGCGRSLGEIESWIRLTAEERGKILADLPRRLTGLHARLHAPADAS
jgi:uncharacterized protein